MRQLVLIVLILTLACLAGCSGGGKSTPTPPSGNGAITGQVSGADPSSFTIVVDGTALEASPDADGSFTIANLPAGTHFVSVVSSDGLVGAHYTVEVAPGGTFDLGDVIPRTGGQIAGLVSQRDEDGNLTPLSGVTVIADSEPVYIMDGEEGSAPPVADGDALSLRATTDDRGSYVIPAVPEGAYVVTVNVPGLIQGVSWVWVSSGTTAAADFQLRPAIEEGVGTVRGTILGVGGAPPGAPLEGATVTINTEGDWQPIPPEEPVPLPVEALAKALLPRQATGVVCPPYWFNQFTTLTDQGGNYSLNVPSGYLSLSVWAEGYESAYESFTLQPRQVLTKNYTLPIWSELPPPGAEQ